LSSVWKKSISKNHRIQKKKKKKTVDALASAITALHTFSKPYKMQRFDSIYVLLGALHIFVLGTVNAQSVCTEFNIASFAPQIICPADVTVLISTSSTPGACSASATFQIPYQKNPFSSTGILQRADGSWANSGTGEYVKKKHLSYP
jgi:hypothetical protein